MAFDTRKELDRIDAQQHIDERGLPKGHSVGSQNHLRRIELELMAEANQLQRNRSALLVSIDDKLGAIAISIEQIDDQLRSR